MRSRSGVANKRGSVFLLALFISGMLAVSAVLLVSMGQNSFRAQAKRTVRKEAFYLAESALQHALFHIGEDSSFSSQSTLAAPVEWTATPGNDNSQLPNLSLTGDQELKVRIENAPSGLGGHYQVTAQAQVFNVAQSIRVVAQKDPPSKVFDYAYFLNNWGWWWGSSIAGNGDNRSNGDFDYRGGPTINGETLARGQIRTDVALKGEAAPKPNSGLMWDPDKIKMYSDKLVMPNLRDFDFYKNLAHNWKNASGVVVGGSLTGGTNNYNIAGVYTGNIYLEGTALNPLVINGPVVIDGNAILTGYITGQGTLYVGRNLYLVGNMEYKNAPNSVRPSDNTQTARDNWVSANGDKDLVAYAARENIVFGDITNSSEWSYPYDIFLKNWGDESHLGADGIPDTADDNTSYDRTGDGVPDGTWFDADEDGTVDGDYQWRDFAPDPNNNTPFQTGDLSAYAYYPTKQDSSELKAWSDLAGGPHGPGYIDKFEGIFYTNHAFAGRTTRNNSQINGAVICKDEAIIFTTNITFNYDERAHSRYNDDPNKIVDLGLPIGEKIRVLSWEELGRTL